jgi:hypothetical protein
MEGKKDAVNFQNLGDAKRIPMYSLIARGNLLEADLEQAAAANHSSPTGKEEGLLVRPDKHLLVCAGKSKGFSGLGMPRR